MAIFATRSCADLLQSITSANVVVVVKFVIVHDHSARPAWLLHWPNS